MQRHRSSIDCSAMSLECGLSPRAVSPSRWRGRSCGGSHLFRCPIPSLEDNVLALAPTTPWLEKVELALKRFEEAGLELPADLTIRLEERGEYCRLPHTTYDPPTVVYCVPWHGEDAWEHELAHVWVEATLSDEDKEAFRDWLGLPTWRSREYPWIRRATEWAAVAIQRYVTEPTLTERQAEIAEWLLNRCGCSTDDPGHSEELSPRGVARSAGHG